MFNRWRKPNEALAREIEAQLGPRLAGQRERLDKQRDRIDLVIKQNQKLRDQAKRHETRISQQQAAIAQLKETLGPVHRAQRQRELDYMRSIQQLGALETRVGRIEESLESDSYTSDDASLVEARNLVDAVRREHDQARVRFQIIASYEERMRRLEAAVVDMYEGDIRHPL